MGKRHVYRISVGCLTISAHSLSVVDIVGDGATKIDIITTCYQNIRPHLTFKQGVAREQQDKLCVFPESGSDWNCWDPCQTPSLTNIRVKTAPQPQQPGTTAAQMSGQLLAQSGHKQVRLCQQLQRSARNPVQP
ncbi:hypothetical protein UPYG_G00292400 [Umbra pygmaea]|uniref:Uncharacterized protein n=1 Tax=Umbra pygmaea TaxID=75934 RepID=A0ABD0W512_UMBPY